MQRQPHSDPDPEEVVFSSESRELEEVERNLGLLLQKGSPIDWQESRRWSTEVLAEYAANCEKSRALISRIDETEYIVGGDEHYLLLLDDAPERVFKLTYGDNFGFKSYFSAFDPDLAGRNFHPTGNADPTFYLRRWRLLNSISPFQTRFEGILPPIHPRWVPTICVSQPRIELENPSRAELRRAFAHQGLVEVSEDAFLCPKTRRLLTDAAPRNVRVIDGIPFPIDAIAELASEKVMKWFGE